MHECFGSVPSLSGGLKFVGRGQFQGEILAPTIQYMQGRIYREIEPIDCPIRQGDLGRQWSNNKE